MLAVITGERGLKEELSDGKITTYERQVMIQGRAF